MNEKDRIPFAKVLAATLDAYGRRPPMPETVELWFQVMQPFSLEQFRMACQAHVLISPKDPPTPGAINEILRAKDTSRPGPEEAWAIAVKSNDESETVLMNDEIAQAWVTANPIFALGDEVGARMAFREVYARLVKEAKGPASWWPSIGTDPYKRDTALSEAKRQNLLPAPQIAAVLPAPVKKEDVSPIGLLRLKEEMEKLTFAKETRAAEIEREKDALRDAVAAKKREIDRKVKNYRGSE